MPACFRSANLIEGLRTEQTGASRPLPPISRWASTRCRRGVKVLDALHWAEQHCAGGVAGVPIARPLSRARGQLFELFDQALRDLDATSSACHFVQGLESIRIFSDLSHNSGLHSSAIVTTLAALS